MTTFDEKEVLERLKKSDVDAYLLLYDRYHTMIYAWAIRLVKIPELAEDIVQEVFLKIWEIRARLNPDLSFPAFVYRIARNKAFTLLKKISADENIRTQVMLQLGSGIQSADNQILWRQYEAMLGAAIRELPKQRQRVFTLCRQEGKTYEEVATELGISRNTVKEHMVMAVKNIRDYFYRYGDISFLVLLHFTINAV